MRSRAFFLPLLLSAAAALACQNTGALHLETQAHPDADFSRYRSYALAPPPDFAGNLPGYSQITGRRLLEIVAARLEETGLEAAEWGEADLQVALRVNGRAHVDVWYHETSWFATAKGSARFLTGSVGVDVFDRPAEHPAWTGHAWQETMDASFREGAGAVAVQRLMARYPRTVRTTGGRRAP